MREQYYRGKLKLTIPEWGSHKKGDIEIFEFSLLNPDTGLTRHEIDDRWEIVEWNEWIGHYDIETEMIYENDRVSFDVIEGVTGNNLLTAQTGYIRWDEEDTGFYIENDNDSFPHVKLWFATNIKIIDNE